MSSSNVSLSTSGSLSASSASSDEEEYTLCAYGDSSLSNIYFIPSLPTAVAPRRDDSCMDGEKRKKTLPPSVRKRSAPKHALPSVIRKILPPSPSAAELSPKADFEKLLVQFRETRVPDTDPPHAARVLPSLLKSTHQPQSRQAGNRKAIDKIQGKSSTKNAPAKERLPLQPSACMNASQPQPQEKPFRGGRLPIRPALPRWDLHEPMAAFKNDTQTAHI
ncbi:hypothetical protein H2248_004437 [Termitomyces sp. 'cryptogamus']|nr:hypothetical protein H2248_004437 [Termitomyces sp. 'cryptogamus']